MVGCVVQSAGTLFFNVTTYQAMHTALTSPSTTGSSGARTARLDLLPRLGRDRLPRLGTARMAADARRRGLVAAGVNLLGCIFFGISAVAGYVVPSTGSMLDLAAANWNTSLGAACFLACALDTLHTDKASKMPPGRRLRELERELEADLRGDPPRRGCSSVFPVASSTSESCRGAFPGSHFVSGGGA